MLSSYNRTEYYNFIRQNGNPYKNNEKVKTKDQILQAFNDFRLDGNVFKDDPINYQEDKTPFRPNQIINFDIRENLNESELEYYNQFSDEEDEYRYISELFLSGMHKKPIKGGIADIMIRKDMGLSDDEEISYGEFINKKKMEFTKESENFIGSARERFFYNAEKKQKTEFKKPSKVANFFDTFLYLNNPLQYTAQNLITGRRPLPTVNKIQKIESKIFDFIGDVTIVNPYLERVKNGEVGQKNLRGEIIEGSMSWGDTFAQGLYDIRYGQQYNQIYNDILYTSGQKQEIAFNALNKLIKQKNELDSITGSSGDFSNASPMTRVWMEGTRVVAPILETALPMILTKDFKRAGALKKLAKVKKDPKLLGTKIQPTELLRADSAKVKQFKKGLRYGLMVRNVNYWRRQGAGDLKSTLIGDRDIRNISQQELQQIDQLADIIALPYAGIEFIASAIPMKGLGGNWTRALSRKIAKQMGARFIGATATKATTTAALNYFGELLEEGFQEVIMDIGRQAGKKLTEEDREILGNQLTVMQALLQADLIDAGEKGLEAMEQAKYAVALLGGGAFVTDLVSANNEFHAIIEQKEKLLKQKNKDGEQLYTEDEALDLATKELGFFGKKGQKEAIIVKDKKLLEINGVDSKESEKLIEDKFNAKGDDRKEAYDNFNKALIKAVYKKRLQETTPELVDEYLKKYESQLDALAELHTTAELVKDEDARIGYQEMIREQEILIGKTIEIDTFGRVFEDIGLSSKESNELATEFVEARGTKSEEFVRKKILDKLNDFMIKYEGRTGLPYSTVGFLTETDFNNLKNQGMNEKNPVYERIVNYIDSLPDNEKELLKDLPETFLKGVNGDKEAQTQYNQLLSDIRDIDYQKYLDTYNFFDPDFTPSEQITEESQTQPLTEAEINAILTGKYDEIAKKLAEEKNISLQEARQLLIDQYNEQVLEQEETAEETEEQKEKRINELSNAKDNLAKALQNVFPEAQIILHKTEAEYNKSSEAPNTEGVTIIGADDSLVIHINAEVAKPELFVHEGFHASLGALEQLYNNTKGTQDAFEERLKEVFERAKKYLPDDIKDEIDVHLSRYGEAEYKAEEALAKLVEILSRNYQALPKTEKNLIIKFLEELMDLLGLGNYKDSIFNGGFKIKKNMPKSDKQIINTLNNMAVALSEGLEIKTSDLDVFRPDIENLTKADMIARAKELGVEGAETKAFARKSKEEITKAIRKQFGKRKVRASYTNVRKIVKDKSDVEITELIKQAIIDKQPPLTREFAKLKAESGVTDPLYGQCFVGTEALYHLLGGKKSGYTPTRGKDADGYTHWWLLNKKTGQILDPTADQYYNRGLEPPYDKGIGGGFPTPTVDKKTGEQLASKRSEQLLDDILQDSLLKPKRKMRASKQTPEGGRAQVINEVEKNETHYKTPKERIPKKTVKAYKLVRVGEDGKLYPLFANANTPFEEGEWMSAGIGKRKTIKGKEKVVGKGMSSGLAPRAGFHTADVLIASQIGGKARPTDTKPNYRVSDTIWVEVEVGNDVDWQAEANKRGKGRKAEITETTPQGGHYKYKTNPNMTGEWLVSGEMKITKRLTKLERKEIAEKTGINDLPSLTDLMEMENIKFEDLNKQSQKEFNKTNKKIRFSKARGDFKVPVKEGVNIEDFDGFRVSTTQSDKLLGGYFNQQRFLGGVFYPAITGRIWAATNKTVANNIVKQFEGVEPNEDGYYYLIPIVMGEDTHLSNQTMRKMFFQHFGTALKNNELTRDDLLGEIQRVTSLAPFKGKKLTNGKLITEAMNEVTNKLLPEDMLEALSDVLSDFNSMNVRKKYISLLLGKGKKAKYPSIGTIEEFVNLYKDPILDDVPLAGAVNMIRFKGKPRAVETDPEDGDYHESYPFHIETDGEVEVLFFDRTQDVLQIIPEFTKLDGATFNVLETIERLRKQNRTAKQIRTDIGKETHVPANYNAVLRTKDRVELPEDVAIEQKVVKKIRLKKKKLSENEEKILAEFIEAIKESRIADPSILSERTSPESITKRDLDLTLQGFNRFNPNEEEQQIFANDVIAVQKSYDYQGTVIYVKNQFTKLEQGNKLLYNQFDIIKVGLHKSRLENMINDLDAQILEETKKGNVVAVDQLQEKADFLIIDLDATVAVARALNKASGTTLRYIGLTKSNLKYYSLSNVLSRAQRNLGDQKLTKEDRKFIKDVTDDLSRLEKEIDELTEGETELRTADLEANAKKYVKIIRGKLKLTEAGKRKRNQILRDIRDNKRELMELGLIVKDDVRVRPSIKDDLKVTPEIKKLILDLSKFYIELGETTLEGLVKKLKGDLPQFSRTDILNILGNRTESTVKKEISFLKETLIELRKQARLTAVLEDLLIGIQDEPKKRKPDTEEVARLKKEIKIAKTEKAIYENEELYNTIAIVEEHINEFTSGRSNDKSAEERLQSALDRLREVKRLIRTEEKIQQVDEMLKMQPSIAIDIIEDRKRKPKEIKSKELDRKLIELSAKKAELNNRLYNYQLRRNKGTFLAREIVGIPRALLATADMSYALRQGLIVSVANPRLAAKTFGQAFQAFFSEDKARLIDENIKRSDMQPLRDQYGLYLSSMDGALDAREEVFMTNFLKKFDIIPNFGGIVSASERNMVTGLNLLRTGLFDDFVNKHPDAPPEALEAYANYINVCTGRGSLKQFSGAAEALSYAFFSPRFAVSRVQAPFTAAAIALGNKGQYAGLRKEVARQWFFLIGTGLAIINLAILAGAEGEDDPEDTDFGKIQLGSQRWDIFGGLVQPARIMALAVKSVYAGFDEDVEVDKDAYKELRKFIEYKFNPIVNISRELITQKDSFTGRDIDFTNPEDLKEQALSTFTPIIVQTFFDAAREDLNAVETGMSVVPEIFGVSSGIYSNY